MSPLGKKYDFQLNNKGYMLVRGQFKGRAWHRTGTPDTPGRRSAVDAEYGTLPDVLDHPEVWDDWSGGFGQAYRRQGENTYHWAENFDARIPRQLTHAQLPIAVTMPVGSAYGANNLMDITLQVPGPSGVEGAGMVFLTGPNWNAALHPGVGTVHNYQASWSSSVFEHYRGAAAYGSFIYVGDNSGTNFWQYNSGISSTVASAPGYVLATVGNRLWRAGGPAAAKARYAMYVQNVADPAGVLTMANWSATYQVGNYNAPIQAMIGLEDQLCVGTRDGFYVGDQTGTFVNVIGDLVNQTHEDNCRALTVHNGGVIIPHIAGLYRYRSSGDSAGVDAIGPSFTSRGPILGRFRTVRGYGRYLYAGLYTGSQSWLLSGEEGADGWKWHTLQRLPDQGKIDLIHVDGITTSSAGTAIPNRIWVTTAGSIDTSGTARNYYWPIPTLDGNPLAPSPAFSANYIGSARMDMGIADWGAPTTPKVYRSAEVWAENLASGAQWANLFYMVDGGTRKRLGTTAKSPKDTLYFPDDTVLNTTNLLKDPSFELNSLSAHWAPTTGFALSTTYAYKGSYSVKHTASGIAHSTLQAVSCAASNYILSCYARRSDGTDVVDPDVRAYIDSASAFDSITAVGSGWFRCVKSITVTAATHNIGVTCNNTSLDIYVDAIQFEQASAVTAYCDGSLVYCDWTGTANGSTSVRYGGYVTGQSIALSLESFTASSGVTPIYRALILRGALRPRSNDEITAVVRVADNIRDRQGSSIGRSGATILQELRDLAVSGTPTTLIDLAGATNPVVVLAPVAEEEVYQHGEEYPEIAATLRMAVLTFS